MASKRDINNMLIGKFMGLKLKQGAEYGSRKDNEWRYQLKPNKKNHQTWMLIYNLDYDRNWNTLMEVVEKIEKIQLPYPAMIPVRVEIKGGSCRIYKGEWNDGKEGFISYVSYIGQKQYGKKSATYLAVLEFIKWYNENVKK